MHVCLEEFKVIVLSFFIFLFSFSPLFFLLFFLLFSCSLCLSPSQSSSEANEELDRIALSLNGQGCSLHNAQYSVVSAVTTRAGGFHVAGGVEAIVLVVVVVVFIAGMDASVKVGIAALGGGKCPSKLLTLLCFLFSW